MSHTPTYVLGINAYDHDVSACLLRDGEVAVAINKERITRLKHDTGFYRDPVAYCLLAAGITLDDVALVVRNSYLLPVADLERRFLSYAGSVLMTPIDRRQAMRSSLFLAEPPRVIDISHHLAHAWSAFACSPFASGAVMVVDGVGSHREDVLEEVPAGSDAPPYARESESYYSFDAGTLVALEKVWLPPTKSLVNDDFFHMAGLGALYSRVSSYIFGHWNRCGEVMGLAPFGRPTLEPLATLEDGRLQLRSWGEDLCRPFTGLSDGSWMDSPDRPHWEDLAWRIQEDTERILVARAKRLHERTGASRLVMAGGVALNCVANGKILEETPFEEVFIQPAAGDDGIALGCALYGHVHVLGNPRPPALTHPYFGMPYPEPRVQAALESKPVRMSSSRRRSGAVAEDAADLLAAGKVLGWFQGGSEFGPRSLGNRSILADPRTVAMKDHVNARVKHRQGFRPFAPAVLAEHALDWFELAQDSPFMLFAARVHPDKQAQIAGVVHVDGTARVQTVHRETNPRLHALLSAFHARTGVPVLLNTSFNVRGEPIVETPEDAVRSFLTTKLDALILHDWVVEKRAVHRYLEPLLDTWYGFRSRMSSAALRRAAAVQILDEDGTP
jgi:carbamoyltransferase